ncbi:MAG TPA: hypothetical protein VNH42_05990 [Mariprofundaceae bacterium]|nr:hypothetical protein [Mariprofundaceae bacterium]
MKRSKMWMGLLALLMFASPALAEDNGMNGADQGSGVSDQSTMQNDQQGADDAAGKAQQDQDMQQGDDSQQQDDQSGDVQPDASQGVNE